MKGSSAGSILPIAVATEFEVSELAALAIMGIQSIPSDYIDMSTNVPRRTLDALKAVANLDCPVRSPVHAPHGELRSSIHRSRRACFISDPPQQLLLGRWIERRFMQGGLPEEALFLLLGIEPVGGNSSQVDLSSAVPDSTSRPIDRPPRELYVRRDIGRTRLLPHP